MNLAKAILERNHKHGDKAAIGFKKEKKWEELSWKKFQEIIFKTANALRGYGIKENDNVAIYSDNSAEWIIFDLAIMTIGAVTVPIYSTNNSDQAEYIINDSGAVMVLVGNQDQYNYCYAMLEKSPFLKTIIAAKNKIIGKKDHTYFLREFIEDAPSTIEFAKKDDEDLATLIYTSGTTGLPKGVMLTHGNFIKAFEAHFEFFKFKKFEKETSLAFLPLTHVYERSWTLLCLYGGAKVCFLEDPKTIAHALVQVKPTMMSSVPRFYQKIYAGINDMVAKSSKIKQKIFKWATSIGFEASEYRRINQDVPYWLNLKNRFADILVFNKIKKRLGGRLWFMPCGGASISEEVCQFFESLGLHITVGYGLTETTATLTAFPFNFYQYGSCGKILPGVEIRIGDNNEIQARGNGIMKGYYNNTEETKKVFTEDGWFKTGDAGKIDEHNNLFLTDRIKDLMKTSNGKFIAPQQLENIFSNNSYIQQIMVVAEGRQFVSALIVPNFEFLDNYLKDNNIEFTNWEDIVKREDIINFYRTKIEQEQKDLAAFQRIKKFVLLPSEFEINTGEITPTLKIKRNIVTQKYADIIQNMYN